ncbi:G-protein coupled receptor 176 isoform X3 [Manis pentadactyla]|uniref:G-protein coupled receptor 176 isoform X3 n=1 Tax=Manis pentadactyla TaxID=143292 RepID=UPI00255C35CE|nr:G-protein coupled receptor 176 isoform X3 [Manis pentadactyla]
MWRREGTLAARGSAGLHQASARSSAPGAGETGVVLRGGPATSEGHQPRHGAQRQLDLPKRQRVGQRVGRPGGRRQPQSARGVRRGAAVPPVHHHRAGRHFHRLSARYYSVLYPLERKISDAKSRELVMYIWAHAVVASIPVFAVTNVADIYAMSTCTEVWSNSLGHLVYVLTYNITTVIVPVIVVFLFLILIRRALSTSQKKKVIIAALRTPQNTISIPYASQREAELHATLLSMVMVFILCSVPYATLVVYQTVLNVPDTSVFLLLTAIWLPKVSLLANPVLFLTVNKAVRKCLVGTLVQLHHRYSRRNVVSAGSGLAEASLEPSVRSGSQLLEMFHIGQQQIFKPTEDEEESEAKDTGSADLRAKGILSTGLEGEQGLPFAASAPPLGTVDSISRVALAAPGEPETFPDKYSLQFGFGPFELPPQWLSETRNSKKRLLPPLGNTPEELIQTKMPKVGRVERKMSRNNKVSIFPKVDS